MEKGKSSLETKPNKFKPSKFTGKINPILFQDLNIFEII